MSDENWIDQYKQWKSGLKPFQINLLKNGAESQSQQWLINSMWCEWVEMKKLKEDDPPSINELSKDPWDDEVAC